MERCFIISKDSDFFKAIDKYDALLTAQKKFVFEYLREKGIEAKSYYLYGNGSVNKPFRDWQKSDIRLSIEPTENDISKFGKMLTKVDKHGLRTFRANSKITKEFAEKCVEEEITINLHKPCVGEYFKSIGFFGGYNSTTFYAGDVFYVRVESNYLKEDDTPDGFTEIKQSEYYRVKEEYENATK